MIRRLLLATSGDIYLTIDTQSPLAGVAYWRDSGFVHLAHEHALCVIEWQIRQVVAGLAGIGGSVQNF